MPFLDFKLGSRIHCPKRMNWRLGANLPQTKPDYVYYWVCHHCQQTQFQKSVQDSRTSPPAKKVWMYAPACVAAMSSNHACQDFRFFGTPQLFTLVLHFLASTPRHSTTTRKFFHKIKCVTPSPPKSLSNCQPWVDSEAPVIFRRRFSLEAAKVFMCLRLVWMAHVVWDECTSLLFPINLK